MWKENLELWSTSLWEAMSIMKSSYVLTDRYENMVKANMLQVTTEEARLMREDGKTETYGLNQGLNGIEHCPSSVYWQKHPTLPLMFEYPSEDVYRMAGLFLVTADANKYDQMPKQSVKNFSYNKNLSVVIQQSSKRPRHWTLRTDDDGDNEWPNSSL